MSSGRGPAPSPPRSLRRFHRLRKLSKVQIHAAHHARNQMPEMRRRRIRPPRYGQRARARPHLLRLQPLSRLRLHFAARTAQRTLPEMRRAFYRRKAHEGRQLPFLRERRMRLGDRSSARTSSRSCGSVCASSRAACRQYSRGSCEILKRNRTLFLAPQFGFYLSSLWHLIN